MINTKVISIGDEILIGQIVNTNSAFINEKLNCLGIKVKKVVTIGDIRQDLLDELQDSVVNDFKINLITGGLGPTHDDITKPILLEFFNDKLILDEKVLEKVKSIFAQRNVIMPETNIGQAMIPSKSKVIWNEYGTAPGILMEKDDKMFIAMPGVPFEMKAMIENSVLPLIKEKYLRNPEFFHRSKTLLTAGIGESLLSEQIGNIEELLQGHKMAFLPSPLGVRLRIEVKCKTEADADSEFHRIENSLYEKIGDYIYGQNDDLLEELVGKLLIEKNLTIAAAESCTGGIISGRITDVSGSSKYFKGSIISYANEVKENILMINADLLNNKGAVSSEVAVEMAVGVRKLLKTDIGISATGIAGPTGGTESKPVGLVYIAISIGDKTYSKELFLGDNRHRNRIRAAQAALEMLRKELLILK